MSLKITHILKPAVIAGLIGSSALAQADTKESMVDLGRFLFNSPFLSKPIGQSCASCHAPETGFTSPSRAVNARGAVVHGAVRRRAGNRKPPTSAYVTYAENFEETISSRTGQVSFVGGTFWDGRATGEAVTADIFPASWDAETTAHMTDLLGPAADQAMGPLLNDVEQNLEDPLQLCRRVRRTMPIGLWAKAWGEPLRCNDPTTLETTHKRIALAMTAYEASPEVSPFSSLWDMAMSLETDENGEVSFPLETFSEEQNLGHEVYQANCRFCHSGDVEHEGVTKELFTKPQARYANIGVPINDQNPFYRMNRVTDDNGDIINPLGGAWLDLGLAGRGDAFVGQEGKMKTPTLRNVAKKPHRRFIKAYMHNGYFKSLESLVHFYNTRDMKPSCEAMLGLEFDPNNPMVVMDMEAMMFNCWPAAEVEVNQSGCNDDVGDCKVELAEGETFETYCDNPENPRDLGNMCLTEEEEKALVAFMETLSDQ